MAKDNPFSNTSALLEKVASNIREGAILGALAANAIHGYAEDDITQREAFRRYGEAWVKNSVRQGLLHPVRIGAEKRSAKHYSVFAIETLKRAQKHIELEYNAAMIKSKEYETAS